MDNNVHYITHSTTTSHRCCGGALEAHHQLTCGVVIDVVVALGTIDAEENLVVVVLVPVKGEHAGAAPLWVAAKKARHAGHELSERRGTARSEERRRGCKELLGALALHQLGHTDRQTGRQMNRQTDGRTDRQVGRQMNAGTHGRIDRQTGRQINRWTDGPTDRQM